MSKVSPSPEAVAREMDLLDRALKIAKRYDWGDITDPTEHGEDCDCASEDAYSFQRHEATCEVSPGARIDLVTKEGTAWPVWPDVDCCDPTDEKDEERMYADCDCSLGAWDLIHTLLKELKALRTVGSDDRSTTEAREDHQANPDPREPQL